MARPIYVPGKWIQPKTNPAWYRSGAYGPPARKYVPGHWADPGTGATVADWLAGQVRWARIDCWAGAAPPLILCESKATAAVLRDRVADEYLAPVAGLKGQARGFLEVEVAPLLWDAPRLVLYVGDLDRSGEDIEQNTRRVLERASGVSLDWRRLAMTPEQADDIEPIWKVDGRDGNGRWSWEVESLGQSPLVALVREALDALLPEPLADVHVREQTERRDALERLNGDAA